MFKNSYLGISNFDFLSLRCIKVWFSLILSLSYKKMSILPLTPKLHYFGFQNYNTHPAQNDVVLVINIYIFQFSFFLKKINGQNDVVLSWVGVIILNSVRGKIVIFLYGIDKVRES
jgi:hypothetical protein